MNANEIVMWLRQNNRKSGWTDIDRMMDKSADLIESLQAQLASSEIPCCECGGEVVEFTIPNDIWNSVMRPDGHETDREYLCLDCWHKALRQWMHGMQRREQAAVEDMKQTHCIGASCYICKNHGKCERERIEIGHCALFDWRGPQEAGGDADARG